MNNDPKKSDDRFWLALLLLIFCVFIGAWYNNCGEPISSIPSVSDKKAREFTNTK